MLSAPTNLLLWTSPEQAVNRIVCKITTEADVTGEWTSFHLQLMTLQPVSFSHMQSKHSYKTQKLQISWVCSVFYSPTEWQSWFQTLRYLLVFRCGRRLCGLHFTAGNDFCMLNKMLFSGHSFTTGVVKMLHEQKLDLIVTQWFVKLNWWMNEWIPYVSVWLDR